MSQERDGGEAGPAERGAPSVALGCAPRPRCPGRLGPSAPSSPAAPRKLLSPRPPGSTGGGAASYGAWGRLAGGRGPPGPRRRVLRGAPRRAALLRGRCAAASSGLGCRGLSDASLSSFLAGGSSLGTRSERARVSAEAASSSRRSAFVSCAVSSTAEASAPNSGGPRRSEAAFLALLLLLFFCRCCFFKKKNIPVCLKTKSLSWIFFFIFFFSPCLNICIE